MIHRPKKSMLRSQESQEDKDMKAGTYCTDVVGTTGDEIQMRKPEGMQTKLVDLRRGPARRVFPNGSLYDGSSVDSGGAVIAFGVVVCSIMINFR